MDPDELFQTFNHGHHDLVLAADYNFYGNRLVTAAADHRLKVWDKSGDDWKLIDSWKAHDAEITDVKWNGPFIGQILGSIGEDGLFKLWSEDVSQPRLSGRRFRQIMGPLATKSQLPWASIDFKNINTETYLALITRDGELSIMEPKDHDMLSSEWTEWTRFSVCGGPPNRMNEASFKVCFHHEKLPCWEAVAAGLDYKALSLAVAAMETVKIYRTDRDRKLYLAAELTGARDLVRDVAWANGSMRGYDVLATASKDGLVRIYELRTPPGTDDRPASQRLKSAMQDVSRPSTNSTTRESGISAGFASAARMQIVQEEDEEAPGRVKQVAKLVSVLDGHQGIGGVWRVVFSHAGDLLVTTGDDGAVRSYKKAVSGKWLEYAQIDVDDLAPAEA